MKVNRCICSVLALIFSVTLFAGFAPVASADDYVNTPMSSWDLFLHRMSNGLPFFGDGNVFNSIVGQFSGAICETSSDGYHHSRSLNGCSIGMDTKGSYALTICKFCGEKFKFYSSDLENAYDNYVQELPSSVLDSGGYLYWRPRISGGHYWFKPSSGAGTRGDLPYPSGTFSNISRLPIDVTYSDFGFSLDGLASGSGGPLLSWISFGVLYSDIAPISGYYQAAYSCSGSLTLLFSDQSICTEVFESEFSTTESPSYVVAGDVFSGKSYDCRISDLTKSIVSLSGSFESPFVRITPVSGLIDPVDDETYGSGTRPGSLTGITYGYQDENGDTVVYTAKDSGMFNEQGDKAYLFNPITGETYECESWQYDYANRRYEIVLAGGGNASLEYGDDQVIMTVPGSGGVTNIYNYYYMGDGSGEGGGEAPGGCKHTYDSIVTKAPTCTMPGQETYTCSKCQHTYTQSVPATGHNWEVKKQVLTSYDDNGNIIQEGYTIYKCSVCSEEYKSTDSSKPPGGSEDGTDKEGFLSWLWGQIKALLSKVFGGVGTILDFIFGTDDSPGGIDFYNHPSTFSGVSVWD